MLRSPGVNPNAAGSEEWPARDSGQHEHPEGYPGPSGDTNLAL